MEHDKLATRLSLIIYKLNQGERLTIESLANEFGVSKRTIERDIARFSYFDINLEQKRRWVLLQNFQKICKIL